MATTQLRPEWQAAVDEIWAMMRETAERQKETDRQMKENAERQKENAERQKETDRQMKKSDERMANLQKTVELISQNVGGLNRSLGELIETLIAARLWEKFTGYNLQRAYQRVPIFDESNRILTDIDILLSNTDVAMAVEVKRELNDIREIDRHLKRMELIRERPPAEVAGKKLLGAMAGGVVDADARRYAWESGFYVLELTGDTVELIPPPEGFVPRQW
jgi:predicted AAA+ superfamily ATPase